MQDQFVRNIETSTYIHFTMQTHNITTFNQIDYVTKPLNLCYINSKESQVFGFCQSSVFLFQYFQIMIMHKII